ncbi:hypothetical protein C2845_PM16G20600 [Panicum miliaceum]|uniref:Uncharacterized protein n=1 Tax=Panicum miliaceum TaxID=4540 RepID=A0A3L6Q2Q5_PANMI|nr:hypothetical protein C2845_PM16G20600 [Panicum miliaceum]
MRWTRWRMSHAALLSPSSVAAAVDRVFEELLARLDHPTRRWSVIGAAVRRRPRTGGRPCGEDSSRECRGPAAAGRERSERERKGCRTGSLGVGATAVGERDFGRGGRVESRQVKKTIGLGHKHFPTRDFYRSILPPTSLAAYR